MKSAMRVTMDASGRLVLPKKIREEAGIEPGMPLEVRVDTDGRIEIEPAHLQVRIAKKGPLHVAVPLERVEPLTTEAVRQTQLTLRERRKAS
jgi:AbrB family looped-hinge helix DNA binding protein